MIDRDQLREALAKFDALPDDNVIVVKSLRTFPAFEAARLVANPDTLVISKVLAYKDGVPQFHTDGTELYEWPEWALAAASGLLVYDDNPRILDALLDGQPE